MPLFDLRCTVCESVEDNVVHPAGVIPSCPLCGSPREHIWKRSAPVHIFPEGFFENAADEDGRVPYFSSRAKYKAYLKEKGMYADLVEGR